MTEFRVLQYRTTYISHGSNPIYCDISQRLKLIDVAYVERENKSLEFVVGSKGDIWPG